MFPPIISENIVSKGRTPSRVKGVMVSLKFKFVPSSLGNCNSRMIIRQHRKSHCPNNLTYHVSSRREHAEAYFLDPSERFANAMVSVKSDGSCFLSGFTHQQHQFGHGQAYLIKDNGHCESMDERTVDGHIIFQMSGLGYETVDITVTRDPISVTVEMVVCLTEHTVLEYPLVRSVSFVSILQIPQVFTETRKIQESGGVAYWNSIGCLCLHWAYIVFSLCACILSHQLTITSAYKMSESTNDSTPPLVLSLAPFDWSNSNVTEFKDNEGSLDQFHNALGNASPPEHQQFYEHSPRFEIDISNTDSQQLFQGQREVPAAYWPSQQNNEQPEKWNFVGNPTQESTNLAFQQQVLHHEVPSNFPHHLAAATGNGNVVYPSAADILISSMTQEVSLMEVQGCGVKWNPVQLQVCPDSANQETECVSPFDDEYSVLELSKYLPPILPASSPTPVVGTVGGTFSGNFISSWPAGGWENDATRPSNSDFFARKAMKKMSEPIKAISTVSRLAKPIARHPPPSTGGGSFGTHQKRKVALTVNDLISQVVMDMLGYMKKGNQPNNNYPSSFAKSATNSSDTQGGTQGGGSSSSMGFGVNNDSLTSSNTTQQTTMTPQQYVLGCAGSSQGNGGREEEKDRDGSTITLKKLLETPYSPRGKSTRNRELEEYQQMLAEEDLQRQIEELKAKDNAKQKFGSNSNGYNNSGGWHSN